MLEKKVVVDLITAIEDGQLQVREATIISEDGKELSRSFRRYVLEPGTSTKDHDQKVAAVASALWTPKVVEDFQVKKAAILASNPLNKAE